MMVVTFKTILILTIFLIFSISAVSAHDINETVDGDRIDNDDSTISNMTDITTVADKPDTPGTFEDLASEIANASAGSVIELSKDYEGHSGSSMHLNKDLTIDGHGHTLNCNHGSYLFNSQAGNITLKNIIIANGSNSDRGAVYIEGSAEYTIVNCTFVNNHADLGGAIYNGGDNVLTITNCNFTSNYCDNQGGAIYSMGDIHIVNSTFDSNNADVDGGAIFAKRYVFVCNTTFQNNRAEGARFSQCYGGAIRSKDVYINNCTFVNNYAEDYGGAIFAYNVYINYNLNNSGEFNTFFINNRADDNEGGAIFTRTLNASDAIFSANIAYVDGGAIKTDRVIINHCLFDFNHAMGAKSAKSYGGAICAVDADINNSGFINNYAQNRGGAIYADNLASCINSYFENNIARDHGGAIYACRFNKNVINVSFVNNTAQECDGGAVYVYNECSIAFSQCTFVSNHCGDEGGAIYIDSSKSHLWIVGNCFEGNSASDDGQAVYNCGNYNQIQNNFWAGANPSAGNDQLIEWKAVGSNVHHCDSNPVILDFIFDPHMEDGEFLINVKVVYVTSDGVLFNNNFDMVHVTYEVSEDGVSAEIKNVNKEKNSVSFDFKPVFGANKVTIHYKGYTLSKDVNIEPSLSSDVVCLKSDNLIL